MNPIRTYIDHTLLKPDAMPDQIHQLCAEAEQNGFASVCVNPVYVSLCADALKESSVKVCTVIGFPLGMNETCVKVAETMKAIEEGADEVDMVINIGLLKSGDLAYTENDIKSVVEAAQGRLVKVIIETGLLTDEEKVTACRIAKAAGADYVKTCTGFSGGAATVHDIALMRETVGPDMGVKASGGVRDYETAIALINAGATRIGASAGIAIAAGEK